ncbi:MAG: TRAP transporter large permease subunit [Betaproteobacteria bacterium]
MSDGILIDKEQAVLRPLPAWQKAARAGEDLGVVAALALMVILPLLEIVLRRLLGVGISGSAAFVQHLVLFVGMLGAAVAAREGRLLSLATAAYLKNRWETGARIFGNAFGAAMSALLCAASVRFVLTRKEAGETLAYGIPVWTLQTVLPVGFGLVTASLIWLVSARWRGRIVALALAGAIILVSVLPPVDPALLVTPGLFTLGIATLLGAPVFVTLGGAALILFWGAGQTIAMIPIDLYRLVVNPTLPAIPLFTLAGYFLAEGGASGRLVRVFQTLFGRLRGGPAIVTALVCAFFTSFTGASGVTILALGGLLMPVLLTARYQEKDALGLLTGAGSLGLLFPPCLPLILYAIVSSSAGTEVSIKQMFLGGIGPGLVMLVLTMWWGIRKSPGEGAPPSKFATAEAFSAVWSAKWEIALPAVSLIALFGGFATPVEASAITALYAFVVEAVIHRDLKLFRDVPRVMRECGLMVGGVLLILGVAMGLTDYLFDARVPERAADWAQSAIHSRWAFLLALNLFLLIVGCLMDVFSAIVVVGPLVIPIGQAFGIEPVHLGIIFLANLELGYLTPPVGMNLFLSSYRFSKPMGDVIHAVLPMLLVLLLGVLLTTYCPPLTTALPRLFP